MKNSCKNSQFDQLCVGRRGFTLIELLVVIAIIGLLGTLAVSAVNIARSKAKTAGAQRDIDQISKAMDLLVVDTGEWPGHQSYNELGSGANNEICGDDNASPTGICTSGLSDNTSGIMADDGSYSNWSGPYMILVPSDPWDYEYFFDTDYQINNQNEPCQCDDTFGCSDAVVIGSYGPDGLGKPAGGANAYGCDDIIKILYK